MKKEEIDRLHATRRATPNKLYVSENGDTYIGTSNGRIRLYKSAAVMYVYPTAEDVFIPSASAGDVSGPASAVDSNFASFDGTTGKLIKDSGYAPADFQPGATGTPDGTKYLRDDNSWQPVASGGLTSPQVLARTLGS